MLRRLRWSRGFDLRSCGLASMPEMPWIGKDDPMTWPNDRPLTAAELSLLASWHEWQSRHPGHRVTVTAWRAQGWVAVCDEVDPIPSISEALGKAIRKAEDEMAWRALTRG